jgi:hypothetical protein
MNIHDFRWIEYAVGKHHTDFMIRWEELQKYREQAGDKAQFISRTCMIVTTHIMGL